MGLWKLLDGTWWQWFCLKSFNRASWHSFSSWIQWLDHVVVGVLWAPIDVVAIMGWGVNRFCDTWTWDGIQTHKPSHYSWRRHHTSILVGWGCTAIIVSLFYAWHTSLLNFVVLHTQSTKHTWRQGSHQPKTTTNNNNNKKQTNKSFQVAMLLNQLLTKWRQLDCMVLLLLLRSLTSSTDIS